MGATVDSRGARREKQANKEEMGDGGSAPSPFIVREGQPAPPTITGNDGFSLHSRDSSSQAVAEAAWGSGDAHVQSTATRRPRPHAIGARGAPHLTFGFASKPSPSAPWAQGLLSAFWERGSPDCLPAAHGVALRAGPYGPSSPTSIQDPREGPSLARRTTWSFLRHSLIRLAREGQRVQGRANIARFS